MRAFEQKKYFMSNTYPDELCLYKCYNIQWDNVKLEFNIKSETICGGSECTFMIVLKII